MLPIEVVAVLLLAIWGAIELHEWAVYPYWMKKFMTEARKREIQAEKEHRKKQERGRSFTAAARRALVKDYDDIIIFSLPAILIVDGSVFRIGLLYSPYLSFFNPLDTYVQLAGIALSVVGLTVFVPVSRIWAEQVYSKAKEERKMITTGMYAHVRHPYYLSFILITLGMLLVTLNYLPLLLLLALFIGLSIEDEEQELLERYGKEYEEYMKKTGRLFPKIRR
ncbi:MAG: methyltransferase family protein [Candidatus Geothermarchaeales archaeon]